MDEAVVVAAGQSNPFVFLISLLFLNKVAEYIRCNCLAVLNWITCLSRKYTRRWT